MVSGVRVDAERACRMKMITVRQPWASLIANGSKRIETRGYSTPYRGPIIIHAAKSTRTWRDLDAPSLVSERGRIDAALNALDAVLERDDDGSPLSWVSPFIDPDGGFIDVAWRGPDDVDGERSRGTMMALGAVVCVAELVDVVPMTTHAETGDPECIVVHGDGTADWCIPSHPANVIRLDAPDIPDGAMLIRDITDQVPFGEFVPGRYAWMFDAPRPVDPIPCRGHLGLRDAPADVVDRVTA